MEKGFNLLTHIRLCTSQDPYLEAVKIPDATDAIVTKCARIERMPTWQVTNIKSKEEEIIEKAQKEVIHVHFATKMDLCRLKYSELEQKFKIYKSRVAPKCCE